ncbi:MAG TPA: pirin family protein [Hyphomonadaceae bacterium]|jgi:redox-sensitive bicupin YhaK (pirin superfamily)|nr:pirin family protein [Hyphomonadaceae bacterium]
MTLKNVLAVHPSRREDIGDLVTRASMQGPQSGVQVDPFIFLAHHGPQVYPPNNRGLPFGPHPHRGFETVTFILEGELTHSDSGGHVSTIGAGGVQWMTAGSGLVHAELSPDTFRRNGGPLEILQLWVNLPARLKFTSPRYQGLQGAQIPKVETSGGKASLALIAGQWNGATGPVESITGNFMSVIDAKAGASLSFDGLEGRSIFLYVVSGAVRVNGRDAAEHTLVQLSRSGDQLALEATSGVRLLFGHGQPIHEPVVAHGPFVMNTVEEIRQAIVDYQAGKFGFVPA